jgi:membrane fusion protein (multidrug efflux system)
MSGTNARFNPLRLSALLAVLLMTLSLAACDSGQKAQQRRQAPEVSVVTMREQQITQVTELPGRTSPFRVAEIRPQVNGLIQKRLFEEGSNVKEGQALYQIDPAPFQAALENAEAALGRSQANLPSLRSKAERYKSLLAEKAVSQQDYDDAAAALAQIEADIKFYKATVRTARINLGYTKVTAPISGRIGKSNVTVGAIVTAYQPSALATIQQMDPIYVDVPQSTTDLLCLRRNLSQGRLQQCGAGQNKVKLVLEDGTPYPHEGTLQFRDVTVDPTTGSVILRMVFPNPEGILLPEMFVRAIVNEGVNEKALLVPQQAVSRTQKGDPYAMVVDKDSKVLMRMLSIDRAVKDKWLVSDGLASGDRVIVEGLQRVRPSVKVKAVPYKEKTPSPAGAAQPKAGSK